MGFRYLNSLADRDNLDTFLGLMDLAAGAGDSAANVFELTHRLRTSNPMQLCLKRLAQQPESQALIERRYVGAPYDIAALRAMPPRKLGAHLWNGDGGDGVRHQLFPRTCVLRVA
jgi:ubiquinone biosynthesis protein Coq4